MSFAAPIQGEALNKNKRKCSTIGDRCKFMLLIERTRSKVNLRRCMLSVLLLVGKDIKVYGWHKANLMFTASISILRTCFMLLGNFSFLLVLVAYSILFCSDVVCIWTVRNAKCFRRTLYAFIKSLIWVHVYSHNVNALVSVSCLLKTNWDALNWTKSSCLVSHPTLG